MPFEYVCEPLDLDYWPGYTHTMSKWERMVEDWTDIRVPVVSGEAWHVEPISGKRTAEQQAALWRNPRSGGVRGSHHSAMWRDESLSSPLCHVYVDKDGKTWIAADVAYTNHHTTVTTTYISQEEYNRRALEADPFFQPGPRNRAQRRGTTNDSSDRRATPSGFKASRRTGSHRDQQPGRRRTRR